MLQLKELIKDKLKNSEANSDTLTLYDFLAGTNNVYMI